MTFQDDLTSPDPYIRRKAIIAIGREQDPAALPALAEVVRSDPDPALRELARKAGRYIQAAVHTHEESVSVPERPVSGVNAERARGFFNQALDYHVRGVTAKALDALGKAIDANPALSRETMFVNLAMEMTGLGSSAAIGLLADPVARKNFILTRAPLTATGRPSSSVVETVTWRSALIDVGIYGLVNGALAFVFAVVGVQWMRPLVESMVSIADVPPGAAQEILSSFEASATFPSAALTGITTAVQYIIVLLIFNGVLHLVATTVLGGEGTLTGLIRKTTLFYTVLGPIMLLTFALPFLLMNTNNMDSIVAFPVPAFFVSIAALFWSSKLIGNAYQFGTGKGCASIILGAIVVGLAIACFVTVLGMLAAQSFRAAGL